jgi:hypothetical protein
MVFVFKLRPHRALRYVRYVRYVRCVRYVRYTAWPHRKLCLVRNCSVLTVLTEMLADSVPWESSDDSDDELLLLLSLCKRKRKWVHGVLK